MKVQKLRCEYQTDPVGIDVLRPRLSWQLRADSPEHPAKIHTVKQGENLYRISRRYNLSVDQIRQYNQLDSKADIYPGQKLKVSPPQ